MYPAETIHKYPRLVTFSIEGLSALLVAFTTANLGVLILRALWDFLGRSDALTNRIPFLPSLIIWLDGRVRDRADSLGDLLPILVPSLTWCAIALLAAILLRNALPTVRVSNRGLMIEFSGSWLPIHWEDLRTIKVTEDLAAERFVLLAQTNKSQLTSWHRLYSLFYSLGWRRGFYITSSIDDFDQLLKTVLAERERTARSLEYARPLDLQEKAQSPIFRLLLSPASFFSQRAVQETSAPAAARPAGVYSGPIHATYPARITALLSGVAAILAALLIWHYLSYWVRFLALEIPAMRPIPPFSWVFGDPRYADLYNAYRTRAVPFTGVPEPIGYPDPWWILVAAHLALLLGLPALIWLRNMLPSLETREQGLAIRNMINGRWRVLPWDQVRAFKATEISEQNQILLLQGRSLPNTNRINSLLYDGSSDPGVLITSAVSDFQPMLTQALGRLAPLEREGRPPILRQEARSWLLWLSFKRRDALAALVDEARANEQTRQFSMGGLFAPARTAAALALPLALLVLINGFLNDSAPSFGLLSGAIIIWLFGVLEWPIVSLLSIVLDENTGGGEEDYRALYLYPTSQLPRIIPLSAALLFQVVGMPVFPLIAWIAAIVWAFYLAAGLWETLYEWRGSQTILGGLLPVIWQLLLLLGFLLSGR